MRSTACRVRVKRNYTVSTLHPHRQMFTISAYTMAKACACQLVRTVKRIPAPSSADQKHVHTAIAVDMHAAAARARARAVKK